ncbi:MAG: helix-turn-helix domain-containing protein, partial [Armatimonadia bacterium]
QAATGLSKANLSQHLTLLRGKGVINARRQAPSLYFSVANPKITAACELMHDFLCEQVSERRAITDAHSP